MSVNGFIPQIWTAGLLAALQKALVFGQPNVVNRDYEARSASDLTWCIPSMYGAPGTRSV